MMGRALWGIVIVGLVGMQAIGRAEQPTFRTGIELVNLNVTVLGPDSHPVSGLTQDQFEVFEDGVRQELKFFAAGDLPLDVIILLDMSSSMTGSLPMVQSAAVRFSQALRAEDRASVMGISGGLRILQDFTSDQAAVAKSIRSTSAAGRTPLYASIYTALRELEKLRRDYDEPRRQAVVVLSDGQDTASGFGFEELINSVRRHAVPIYVIAPRPSQTIKAQREIVFGESSNVQDYELRRLATETGARAYFPIALQELTGVYTEIADELAHQYSIGYQSTNQSPDDEFRRIGLRVMAPGVRWRTRTGYIATESIAADDLR
jgi:Ca-activated chloride channel family protein